jgi:hypothetical protein
VVKILFPAIGRRQTQPSTISLQVPGAGVAEHTGAGMDQALAIEVAGGAAALLVPYLRSVADGASGELEAVSGEVGGRLVRRLWALVSGFPKVSHTAQETGDKYFEDDLQREIGRLLETNADLADQIVSLLADAEAAGAPVPGHALAERARAGRDLHVEGDAATVRDSQAGQDIVVRATGARDRRP